MKVFAHRGFSGKYPENTMLAFKKAEEVGCYGIELDVQLTKDDEIVIMHDETIDRTTSGTGNIRDYTYQELCLVDCYGKFEGKYDFQRIPTLREYLTWVKDTGLVTNIELKKQCVLLRTSGRKSNRYGAGIPDGRPRDFFLPLIWYPSTNARKCCRKFQWDI